MKLHLQNGLPFITATLTHQGRQIEMAEVLLDTGSAGTQLSADVVLEIGLTYEADDTVHRIRGVGGTEFVFAKQIDQLSIGDLEIKNFEVEIGAMDYGFEIKGIVGMDFLTQTGAIVDLEKMEINRSAITHND